MNSFLDWLVKYEAVAVWIEGLALVGIFGFDIWVARRDHQETLEQLRLAQDQIRVSHNAERAWVIATLNWFERGQLNLVHSTSGGNAEDGQLETTALTLKLTCTNEGRSPAFITKISGYSETVEILRDTAPMGSLKFKDFSAMGPIGPGKETYRSLLLVSEGHARQLKNILSVYVVIEYTDIFGNNRETTLGYTVEPGGGVYRQDRFPERNRTT